MVCALNVPPERLASSGARLLRRVADNLPAGGEDHYGHGELVNLQGTFDGTKKIADLLGRGGATAVEAEAAADAITE